ncbi:MAG: AAA family ATPase, partial [Bacillota bacterium]|nr:AAA family ATPase [Bacillota bacterium]
MLAELYVEDFALIEELQVDFYDGLNIISGETGAGKSLLTDAVGLLMGNRAGKEFIRYGSKRALVEGTFVGPFSRGFMAALEEQGLEAEDDTLVVTREINGEGKNLCRINGRRVSLSVLNEIVPRIMNLHSQREHFAFLREDKQLEIVDHHGGAALAGAKEEVAAAYEEWHTARRNIEELRRRHDEAEEKKDFLLYRISEIEALGLKPGEDEELRRDIELLRTGTERLELAADIYDSLSKAGEYLHEAMEGLQKLESMDPALKEETAIVVEAYYNIDDIYHTIASYRDDIDADPGGLDQAEQRLSAIEAIKKKENTDLDGVLLRYEKFKKEVEALDDYDYLLSKYSAAEEKAGIALREKAENLRELRQKAGEDLSSRIVRELHGVMLPHAKFSVALEDVPMSPKGMDKAVFLISMNQGEAVKPLSKVASGGEISRILLALEIILSGAAGVQTMIF